MRWLINYIRSCFCNHEWKFEECRYQYSTDYGSERNGIKVSATCEKCGWHRSYWKY
jgi:hypothetical protein